MEEVIDYVLEKKELSHLDRKIASNIISENLSPKIKKIIEEKRFKTKDFKNFVSIIRAQLRRQYGAFQNPKINRRKLLESKDFIGLLNSHQSSKERLPYYGELYKKIFEITGEPKSIIDIGCGMNPVSLEYMNLKEIEYLALDISGYDLQIISSYFKIKKINGSAKVFDAVRDKFEFEKMYDVCFAFKLFEILETTRRHWLTERIFTQLPAKWVVASFSTKTLSGAKMTFKRRVWFEVMLSRLGCDFKTIELPNELFYIADKRLK